MAENAAVSASFHALGFRLSMMRDWGARRTFAARSPVNPTCAPSRRPHARSSPAAFLPRCSAPGGLLDRNTPAAASAAQAPHVSSSAGKLAGGELAVPLHSQPSAEVLFDWEEWRLAVCPPCFRVAAAMLSRNPPRPSLACAGLLSEPHLGPRFVRGSSRGSAFLRMDAAANADECRRGLLLEQ